MQEAFAFDTRLGVKVLRPDIEWERYTPEERKKIWSRWILMCSGMTDRVSELEVAIMAKLEEIYTAKTDDEMHHINDEMMELASAICDLNILARSVYEELNKVHF
jgi:hypothetical protein